MNNLKKEITMKFSTLLLSSGLVLFAGHALATEVTHPFYVPDQGQVLTDTNYSYSEVSYDKSGHASANTLSEQISLGVYDGLAVRVAGANAWTRDNPKDASAQDEDRNLSWSVGAVYNLVDSHNFFAQIGADYGQRENKADVGEYKYVNVDLKGGYDIGYFLPYLQVTGEFPMAQSKMSDNDPVYNFYLGAYRVFGPLALDAGVNYGWDKNDDGKDWSIKARADWLFTDKLSAGIYAAWMFDGNEDTYDGHDEDYDGYTVGLNLKATF